MGKKVSKPRIKKRRGKKETGVGLNAPIIPEEIIAWEILPRLPTKSLVRFRSVCKSWNSLITYDTDFQTCHTRNQGRSRSSSHWVSLESTFLCPVTGKVNLHDEKFRFQPKTLPKNIIFHEESVCYVYSKIIGSCNGVVCFYCPIEISTSRCNISGEVSTSYGTGSSFLCICNPCIQKSRRVNIPWKIPLFNRSVFNMMMGFGYANLSNDYKVVMITKDMREGDHIYVYSLRANDWRKSRTKPPPWTDKVYLDVGTYFNGACYWICKSAGTHKLLCFNLNKEKFRYFDLPTSPTWLPPEMSSSFGDELQILVCKDTLCIWFININMSGCHTIQIWGMKDYGNSSSWISLLHVCIKDDGPNMWLNFHPTLFGIDACGSLLFCSNDKLLSYNPQSMEWKLLKVLHSDKCLLISYKESLALIDLDHQSDVDSALNVQSQTNLPRAILWSFVVLTLLFFLGFFLFPLVKSLCTNLYYCDYCGLL